MRPTSTAWRRSSCQCCISSFWRRSSAARNMSRFSLSDTSLISVASFDFATMARRSRKSTVSMIFSTASTLSFHSATRRRGSSSSTMLTSASALTSGLPSFFSCLFCSFTARRTAPTPPSRAFSASTRSAAVRVSSTALRCVSPGRRRVARGRLGNSGGGGVNSRRGARAASLAPGFPPRRSPRPGRLSLSRGGLLRLLVEISVTGLNSAPDPVTAMSVTLRLRSTTGAMASTTAPSMSTSMSARSTSPTLLPSGRSPAAPEPRGAFAPAWRQVNEPSGRVLVTSMSIRRAMRFPR